MDYLLLFILGLCHRVVAASDASQGLVQKFIPFRFEPPPEQLPNSQYKLVLPQEEEKTFWPAAGPQFGKHEVGKGGAAGGGAAGGGAAGGGVDTEFSFPNPFQSPASCNWDAGVTHSWLCDPYHYLTPDEQAYLESRLLRFRDVSQHTCSDGRKYSYQAAAAILSDILVPEDQNAQQATDELASKLLRQWGIGNKACHDGMLLLYVKNTDTVALATREGVEKEYITPTFRVLLKHRIRAGYMTTGSIGTALSDGVDMLSSAVPAVHTGLGWVAALFFSLAGIYVVSIIVVYFVTSYLMNKKYGEE